MNADLDIFTPVVFRSDFNKFEKINGNQAWSLFFTAGKEDKELGLNPEVGRFFTNVLIGIGVAGIIAGSVFTHIA